MARPPAPLVVQWQSGACVSGTTIRSCGRTRRGHRSCSPRSPWRLRRTAPSGSWRRRWESSAGCGSGRAGRSPWGWAPDIKKPRWWSKTEQWGWSVTSLDVVLRHDGQDVNAAALGCPDIQPRPRSRPRCRCPRRAPRRPSVIVVRRSADVMVHHEQVRAGGRRMIGRRVEHEDRVPQPR